MNIHFLQHVEFEGPAKIGQWTIASGRKLSSTKLYEDANLPSLNDIDWLVIMGGPMNIYQEKQYPWLIPEKAFIGEAIEAGKTVIGVCLGAQLIADVLGAKVYQGKHKEIGWFPIELTSAAKNSALFDSLPDRSTVFHWHGDTFDLPEGAIQLAHSEGCEQQAFLYNEHVLGLQYHLEVTKKSVNSLIKHCADDITEGKYVQGIEQMRLEAARHFPKMHDTLETILKKL